MKETVLTLIDMVQALTKRVSDLENMHERNIAVFNENLNMLVSRLDALETPTVIDSDGVIQMTQEALLAEHDGFKTEMKERVASLQRQFHQHLADHEVNGARPASIHRDRFREIIDEVEKTSPRL
jgi:hypothetical protein